MKKKFFHLFATATLLFFMTSLDAQNYLNKITFQNDTFKNKVLGCVLGSAVGDALGRITERYWMYGQGYNSRVINNFKDFKQTDFINEVALYTDDTQMARIVLETLLEKAVRKEQIKTEDQNFYEKYYNHFLTQKNDGPHRLFPGWETAIHINPAQKNEIIKLEITMTKIAIKFAEWVDDPDGGQSYYRAPGIGCISASKEIQKLINEHDETNIPPKGIYRANGWTRNIFPMKPLTEGGCGSVMRAYPFGLIFADNPQKAAAWSAAHSLLTHRTNMAKAACAAMAAGVACCIGGANINYTLQEMENYAKQYDFETANMIKLAIEEGRKKLTDDKIKQYLTNLEGKLANQAIAAATFLLTCYPNDLLKVIELAVNFYGDTDSVASMAGALVGARVGVNVLFDQKNFNNWLNPLENRKELIQLANQVVNMYR